jgi:hypothetical protein
VAGLAGMAPGEAAPLPQAAPALQPAPPPLAPLSKEAFAVLLRSDDPDQLVAACRQTLQEDRRDRLRQVQARLLELHPAPQPLAVVLADADALLSCLAPEAALTVLDRYGPAPGAERVQWLVLQWRAASAALDHRRASLALERLGGFAGLQPQPDLALPVLRRDDGSVVSRPALDLLAAHLEARGLEQAAAEVLLLARQPGLAGAERLQQLARLLQQRPAQEREALLEAALDQAAALGAWGLVAELLDQQAGLPSMRAVERRLRLSPRIDDVYGEWRLRREDPASMGRASQLERQIRSPREPGGHAAGEQPDPPLPPPAAPAPPAAPGSSPP